MTKNIVSPILSCLIVASLLGSPAIAAGSQQAVEKPTSETVGKATTQKPRTTRPASTKAKSTAPKSTTAVAKANHKPGKRFWSRIMEAFRDVHSVEKKTNK